MNNIDSGNDFGDRDFNRQPRDRSQFGNNARQPFGNSFANNRNMNFNGGCSRYRNNSMDSTIQEKPFCGRTGPEPMMRKSNYNEFCPPKPNLDVTGPIIYLMNISYSASEQDIMTFLADFKPIRARLMKDENGQSKGTCFVQLNSVDLARMAIQELSNSMFQGRKVIINPAYNQNIKAC